LETAFPRKLLQLLIFNTKNAETLANLFHLIYLLRYSKTPSLNSALDRCNPQIKYALMNIAETLKTHTPFLRLYQRRTMFDCS